tara:strand:- start:16552 stop:17967 length:1416 start_codon:yes stop_codon:yes gene_type:complete
MIKAIILAGGSGTRLWPLSRAGQPKQFLSLHGEDTMLQSTFKRLDGLDIKSSVVICNEEHRFYVVEQLVEIQKLDKIILEPIGKSTAPAIALAALLENDEDDDDPVLLVLSADHVVQNQDEFRKVIINALPLAESGKLVTFGIVASEPSTSFGYIKKGKSEGSGFAVDAFKEKPSQKVAEEYLDSGDYFWNSGMFMFKASRYLDELKVHSYDIYKACSLAMQDTTEDNHFLRINKEAFEKCPSNSIDYAIMEKTADAVVVPMDAGWNDIGSWSSLLDISNKDSDGNSIHGDVMLHSSNNSYVRSDDKLVVGIGLDNIIIVSTKDAVMVSHKDHVQDTKIAVEKLKKESRSEWDSHREVCRPWGKYDSIDHSDGYQVKRITVNPGAKLSVQMHYHRSEHWIVVAGKARVHYGKESLDLEVNESTYHGKEVVHSLENSGDEPLELIEVQVGSYLGEDDIVRYEDRYGRIIEKD